MASILVPYRFSLYSPYSINLQTKKGYDNWTIYFQMVHVVEKQQHKKTTSQQHSLVILCICIKGLLSHKVVLHSLLLMALFGPCGVCDEGQRAKNVMWFKGIVDHFTLMFFQTCMTFLCAKNKKKHTKDCFPCNYNENRIIQASKRMQKDHKYIIKVVHLCFCTSPISLSYIYRPRYSFKICILFHLKMNMMGSEQ